MIKFALAGNPNDKVLFARCRSVPSRLERRNSLRLWGSARRLHRSGSSRSLPRRPERSDTSSSAEYASTDSAPHSPTSELNFRDIMEIGDQGFDFVFFFFLHMHNSLDNIPSLHFSLAALLKFQSTYLV